ncbi:MAG: flagellar hook-length control protein FliK [Bacillaceae bacterium]|nr:flagellar hook-length control protein FliK [Bacillaceae bacterium]
MEGMINMEILQPNLSTKHSYGKAMNQTKGNTETIFAQILSKTSQQIQLKSTSGDDLKQTELTTLAEKLLNGTFGEQELKELQKLLQFIQQASEQDKPDLLNGLLEQLEDFLSALITISDISDNQQNNEQYSPHPKAVTLQSIIQLFHDQKVNEAIIQTMSHTLQKRNSESTLNNLEAIVIKLEKWLLKMEQSKPVQSQNNIQTNLTGNPEQLVQTKQLYQALEQLKTLLKHQLNQNQVYRQTSFQGIQNGFNQMLQGTQNGFHQTLQLTGQSQSSQSLGFTSPIAQHMRFNHQSKHQTNMFGQIDTMPISRLEQYTIYLQQQKTDIQGNTQSQLLEQFQKMIQSSRFLKQDGITQMTIKLKPAHLGEMMVKLTQLNGEMAVKITVTSNAVKEMLEGNLHQLRHMFSPNQVVIEKQQDQVFQQHALYSRQDDSQEQSQGQNQQHNRDQQDHHSSKEDQPSFEDILSQFEKVIT